MWQRRWFFRLAYACSGAGALVYELAWTRLLTLHMGHTVAAASIVLAAFMGGLAVGAWISGASVGRALQAQPLRAYAALEVFVALIALALPTLLSLATPLLAWAYADATAPIQFALVRGVLCLSLIGIPAAAMGATFPLAATWAARDDADAAGGAGVLYAVNTAGAAIGAVAAGFWLLPAAGLRGTTWAGVALNLVAAGCAVRLDWGTGLVGTDPVPTRPVPSRRPATDRRTPTPSEPRRLLPLLGCATAAVSGFVALVYEVAWTRLLALLIGPTTYAFATMAAAFIGGLAIGSAASAQLVRRSRVPALWLAASLVLSAVAANVAAWFAVSRYSLTVINTIAAPPSFGALVGQHALAIAALLFPLTFALGATFPLALALASENGSTIGRDTARVYVSNTAGAIAGALCGGFILLPRLGLRSTFQAVGIVGALTGGGCLWVALRNRRSFDLADRAAAAIAAIGAAILIVSLPGWDRALLASGGYLYASRLPADDVDVVLRAGQVEYYKEGAAGTVSVRKVAGTRLLAVDGKVDASSGADMPTQRLLGLLPVLLHPAPHDVLVVGLGSGVTLASALAPGTVGRADVVEISPEVVDASRFFARENKNALSAPGVRLIVGDGRSHLALTRRRYDVIISEPSNPWMAGVAALFTREYVQAARDRLTPDGLMCQWAHTYGLSSEDLRSIVRTFQSVFPESTMWLVGDGDVLLIGTNGPSVTAHLQTLADQVTGGTGRAALAEMSIPSAGAEFALFSLMVGGPSDLARYAGDGVVQTDDRMALEFSAPRTLYSETETANADSLRALAVQSTKASVVQAAFDRATAAGWAARGQVAFDADADLAAYAAFKEAVSLDGRNLSMLASFSRAGARVGRQADVREWLASRAAREPGNAAVRAELLVWVAGSGEVAQAVTIAEEALRLAPGDLDVADRALTVFAMAGNADRVSLLANRLFEQYPTSPQARYYVAFALALRGKTEEAIGEARRVINADPTHVRARELVGAACLSLGRDECARDAWKGAVQADPSEVGPYVSLGELSLRKGDPAAAFDWFAQALFLNRKVTAARKGLNAARAALRASR